MVIVVTSGSRSRRYNLSSIIVNLVVRIRCFVFLATLSRIFLILHRSCILSSHFHFMSTCASSSISSLVSACLFLLSFSLLSLPCTLNLPYSPGLGESQSGQPCKSKRFLTVNRLRYLHRVYGCTAAGTEICLIQEK